MPLQGFLLSEKLRRIRRVEERVDGERSFFFLLRLTWLFGSVFLGRSMDRRSPLSHKLVHIARFDGFAKRSATTFLNLLLKSRLNG